MEKQEKRHREGYHQKEDLAKGEKRKTTAINLFIIREIFKLINNGKLSLGQFYVFLLTSERKYTLEKMFSVCEDFGVSVDDFYSDLIFVEDESIDNKKNVNDVENELIEKKATSRISTYLKNTEGNLNTLFNTLIEYGISFEFFDGERIGVSKNLWNDCKVYFDDISERTAKDRKKIQQELMEEIYTICNLDGSLIINSIRDIIMDMTHTNISENYNVTDTTLLQQIDNYHVPQSMSYTQNNLIKLYSQMVQQVDEKPFTSDVKTSDFSKITKSTDNEFVCDNLFIIIKTYQIFARIEGIIDADEKLSNYLNIEEDVYTNLSKGQATKIKSKDIAEKLSIYRFPVTLFRTDHPTMINLSKNIQDAFYDYKSNNDITLFEFRLQFWLTYHIDTLNIVLVLAVYSLFKSLNGEQP